MSRLFGRKVELGLLILVAALLALMLVSLELSQGNALDIDMVWLIGGFIGVFALAHIVISFAAPYSDQIMLPVAAALNAIGLVMIYRIDIARETALASRQVMWTLVGIVLLVLTLLIIRDHKALSRFSYLLGVLGLVLLALPLVWPQPEGAEAKIWLSLGPLSVQPGEFSKILLLMFFAQLLTQKRALFTVAGYRFLGMEFPRLRDLAPIMVVWAIAILIMAISNDFGPALLLFATVLGMMYFATGRASWLVIGLGLVTVGAVAVYQVSSKIQSRVQNFLDPLGTYHGDGGGFQLSQALFGMSWGGLTGTGLGMGYPQSVPVAWTDFILAGVGEELGLVGLAGVLVLFAIFVSRGFNAALAVRDSYGKLLASGLALTIAIQVFVVTAGISALMPMTGLTTPFMSAGGSALMANYILLGLLLRISDSARRPVEVDAVALEAPGTNMFPSQAVSR
ncbi:FtsW/RodA/SpoVE family cell cycle protein [Corynebacterium breve]|uniref:FtsW/RodA/SpoVE family cell cycle protein n=1 Tax=Corynebacterium breve TaxID=3049799 RepID=A0ABY8VFI8_9CORY|nr:FtsW/RodA/SpoVE family cell cycle protein [Corynebacterium breve]WIM67731.1 FtsW/RodA/SpoVE family cell cycle protein [Corynebacterium breve]